MVEELFDGALKLNEDGSILRKNHPLVINIPSSEMPGKEDGGVASRDVVIDKALGIWVRLYLPHSHLQIENSESKMPVFLYFHGGGFCFLSPAFVSCHRFCQRWAASLGSIVVSVNYRLAPEHRLPAAYHDSITVLQWLSSQSDDPWFNAFGDLNNVFLVGDSSGGNIVHHLLMHSSFQLDRAEGSCIRGAILLQPFFGGEERTQSEIACPENVIVNVKACDSFWRCALPVGVNRDHPFSNPVMNMELTDSLRFPPLLVVLGGKDCLRDRGLQYYDAMLKFCKCKQIELMLFDEEEHGFHLHSHNPMELQENDERQENSDKTLLRKAALFVSSNCFGQFMEEFQIQLEPTGSKFI